MPATNLAIVQEAAGESPADLMVAALMDGEETDDLQTVAALDAAQADDMPMPASDDPAGSNAAQNERKPWPWTTWSEPDPPVQSAGWTQDWQSRPRDAHPTTASAAAAAALKVADTGSESPGFGKAAASIETRRVDPAGSLDGAWAGSVAFLPSRRVK